MQIESSLTPLNLPRASCPRQHGERAPGTFAQSLQQVSNAASGSAQWVLDNIAPGRLLRNIPTLLVSLLTLASAVGSNARPTGSRQQLHEAHLRLQAAHEDALHCATQRWGSTHPSPSAGRMAAGCLAEQIVRLCRQQEVRYEDPWCTARVLRTFEARSAASPVPDLSRAYASLETQLRQSSIHQKGMRQLVDLLWPDQDVDPSEVHTPESLKERLDGSLEDPERMLGRVSAQSHAALRRMTHDMYLHHPELLDMQGRDAFYRWIEQNYYLRERDRDLSAGQVHRILEDLANYLNERPPRQAST